VRQSSLTALKNMPRYRGEIPGRIKRFIDQHGTRWSDTLRLHNLQDRGKFFIDPSDPVYWRQVIGRHSRGGDLVINVTKTKKLTTCALPVQMEKMSIRPSIETFIGRSVELYPIRWNSRVTPKSIRIRKIYLDENERKRNSNKAVAAN